MPCRAASAPPDRATPEPEVDPAAPELIVNAAEAERRDVANESPSGLVVLSERERPHVETAHVSPVSSRRPQASVA